MQSTTDTTTTDTDDVALPATPDEQLEAAIQMDKIREYTVRPGLLRLPVESLDTAANSPQYVVQLHHPVIDDADIRFFIEKPAYWDPNTFLWPRFLNWYGLTTRSQYQLQTERVYVKHNPRTDEWELVAPPSDWQRTWWRTKKAAGHRAPDALARAYRVATAPVRRVRRLTPGVRSLVAFIIAMGAGIATTAWSLSGGAMLPVAALLGICTAVLALCTTALAVEPPAGGA